MDYKLGKVLGITNRGKRNYKQGQVYGFQIVTKDYKLGQGFQIGAKGI